MELQTNKQFLLQVLARKPFHYCDLYPKDQANAKLARDAILSQNSYSAIRTFALEAVPDLWLDREVVLALVHRGDLAFMWHRDQGPSSARRFCEDSEVMQAALQCGLSYSYYFEFVSDRLKRDSVFLITALNGENAFLVVTKQAFSDNTLKSPFVPPFRSIMETSLVCLPFFRMNCGQVVKSALPAFDVGGFKDTPGR